MRIKLIPIFNKLKNPIGDMLHVVIVLLKEIKFVLLFAKKIAARIAQRNSEGGIVVILKLVLLGVLQVTSYRPVPEQTKASCVNRFSCTTSIGENVSELGIAASQDLLKSGKIHYGDVVLVDGFGYRIVNDCLNARVRNSFDLFVYTRAEEKRVGVRHLKVYLVIGGPTNVPGTSD